MSAFVFHPVLCYCVVITPKSRVYIAMIPQYGLWFGLVSSPTLFSGMALIDWRFISPIDKRHPGEKGLGDETRFGLQCYNLVITVCLTLL